MSSSHFAQRFAHVGGVHLVRLFVASARRRVEGVAEGAVECRGVLDGVAADADLRESLGIQSLSNALHATIHHIRWCHHVGARSRLHDGHFGQYWQRNVVVDASVDDDAVVAVGRIGVERHVRNDPKIRNRSLQGAYSLAEQVVAFDARAAAGILQGIVDFRKQCNGRNIE